MTDYSLMEEFNLMQNPELEWFECLNQYENFVNIHNTLPQPNGSPEEKILVEWFEKTLKFYTKHNLPSNQEKSWERLLRKLQTPKNDYYEKRNTLWLKHLMAFENFLATQNRLPLRKSKNSTEAPIANWMYEQLRVLREGPMNSVRYTMFSHVIEKYRNLFHFGPEWQETLNKVEQFIATNKRLPQKNDMSEDENELADWITSQKKYFATMRYRYFTTQVREKWRGFLLKHEDYFKTNRRDANLVNKVKQTYGITKTKKQTPSIIWPLTRTPTETKETQTDVKSNAQSKTKSTQTDPEPSQRVIFVSVPTSGTTPLAIPAFVLK